VVIHWCINILFGNNMNRFFLFTFLAFCFQDSIAQKLSLTTADYNKWPSLGSFVTISNNGEYMAYTIVRGDYELNKDVELIIQSTKNTWKMAVQNIKPFSPIQLDNNFCLYETKNDDLKIVKLSGRITDSISNIASFDSWHNDENRWLIYALKHDISSIFLRDFKTKKQKSFHRVLNHWINYDKNSLFILEADSTKNNTCQSLVCFNLQSGKTDHIWKGSNAKDFTFDFKNGQLAFRCRDSIWYHKIGENGVTCIVNPKTNGIDNELKIGTIKNFSANGKYLFFYQQANRKVRGKTDANLVEIWSYTDPILNSHEVIESDDYLSSIDVKNHSLIRLEQKNEKFTLLDILDDNISTFGLIEHRRVSNYEESSWNSACELTRYILSLTTGERKRINLSEDFGLKISPLGKYFVYLDKGDKNFYSYEIATGIRLNLTHSLNVTWGAGVIAWLRKDGKAIVSDDNDIWLLDLQQKSEPINLTKGYGKNNHIKFSIAMDEAVSAGVKDNQRIILSAFNTETKENGFYSVTLGKNSTLERLTMSSHIYVTNSNVSENDFTPIKARDASVYLVRRQGVKEAPNYFVTSNFRDLKRITYIEPEKDYEWFKSELCSWKSINGRMLQGILYKPENFNPNRKYPVILYYYESKSDGLNAYLKPSVLCNGCSIDIPTYVSKGYLVFCPDTYKKPGDPMQGTYDAVVSAAKYLTALPFIDAKKMGIQGCSFGGAETYYLLTQTNLFSAGCAASGITDWISHYGSTYKNGGSRQFKFEIGQYLIGSTLWEKPEIFISSSPVFYAHRITTPILMMHTKKDGTCDFENAVEFFTAMRRLGKKAWMLVYHEADHGVYGKDALDFSQRMMQFFDHYLKDMPAPVWMIENNSSFERNIEDGFQLDTIGRTPGPGLLTSEEQKKVESLMTKKPVKVVLN
jgi:dienelactone hydrolase